MLTVLTFLNSSFLTLGYVKTNHKPGFLYLGWNKKLNNTIRLLRYQTFRITT